MMDAFRENNCYPKNKSDQVKLYFNYTNERAEYFPLCNQRDS